jgi:PAS domain S-box-containing protein
LLLLDQALPLIDGLELCRTLQQTENTPAIFILSDQPDELGRLLAFAAGADDCLSLPFHPRELLARIKAILRRIQQQVAIDHHVLRCGSLELDSEQRQVRVSGEIIGLTALEYELLYILLRYPGRAFSRTQLLEQLHSLDYSSPFDRTIDIHISNLRRKLSQALGTDAPIETVRGVGYRLRMATGVPGELSPAEPGGFGGATQSPGLHPAQLALAAFERVPVPLLVLAADRTIVLYNEAARRLCGWPADQVIGQAKCYSLLSCHQADGQMLCHKQCVMNAIALNKISDQTARYTITLRDGREVPVVAHYSNLGQPGTLSGYTILALEPDLGGAHLP